MTKRIMILVLGLCVLTLSLLWSGGRQETKPTEAGMEAAPATLTGKVEVFSWWTAGGEAEGLNALINQFNGMYPEVEVINATVAGGAGTNAKAVLKTRVLGGDPPDSFQVHAGHELIDTWVKSNYMEPLTFIYKEEGWDKSMPKGILDIVSYKNDYWSVPVNIHRANVL